MNTRLFPFTIVFTVLLWAAPEYAYADWHDTGGMPAHPETHHSWTSGEFHNHHYYDHIDPGPPPDAVPGHKIGQALLGKAQGDPYDPYSVWINETYHVYDGSAGGAVQEAFSHGFIIEDDLHTPEYEFIGSDFSLFDISGNAFDARQFVRDGFAQWSAITVDDPAHLQMGLNFREYTSTVDPSEITVSFVNYIEDAVAAWYPASQELQFRRYDDVSGTIKHPWYTGDSLLDLPDSANVDDLFTVALHEIGHIVGLDHQNDIDDVMYEYAGQGDVINSSGFSAFRSFSQDDILGARDLYSIPIPEPAALTLLLVGGAALLYRRRSGV